MLSTTCVTTAPSFVSNFSGRVGGFSRLPPGECEPGIAERLVVVQFRKNL